MPDRDRHSDRSAAGQQLQLLGRPRLTRSDATTLVLHARRDHQLLAVLGLEADWVSRDQLASLFWPDQGERAARSNLRKVLQALRDLHVEGLEEGHAGLRWSTPSDVADFRAASQAGEWAAAASLGTGRLMDGLDGVRGSEGFAQWLRAQRQTLHASWRQASLKAVAAAQAQGRPEAALALARRLLDADATDEAAHKLARLAEAALLTPARPTPLSPMVGRQAEWRILSDLLAGQRLVTLFGPGGVGKTRLARHAADTLAAHHANGIVWVSLAGVDTPAALPIRVADALGLTLSLSGDPAAALARWLAPRQLLLVLDGFEPLIDAAHQLPPLLAAAPGLRLLVTSRERLELDGEWLLPLDGLAVPARQARRDEALASGAAMLFVTRARALDPHFDGPADWQAVASICRRVGGLPLALELAAAWVRLMPATQIADELGAGPALLSQNRDAGLRRVFESSWQLLTASERAAWARLAVFRGGFTREAAQAVAEVPLAVLAALVDKSMLRSQAQGRFDMHPLLHDHALEKLTTLPQAAALSIRHSQWFLALPQPRADERQNLLAAWRHAVARGDAAAVDAALQSLPWGRVIEGRLHDALTLFAQAATALGEDSPTAAHLRAHAAWMRLWQGQHDQAQSEARAALARLQAHGPAAGVVMALRTLGHAARLAGRYQEASDRLAAALETAQAAGLQSLVNALRDACAMVMVMQGQYAKARDWIGQALTANEALGDDTQRVYNQLNLSQSHRLAGDAMAARVWAQAAVQAAKASQADYVLPYAHAELAAVHLALQESEQAGAQAHAALERAQDTEDRNAKAIALGVLARIAQSAGDATCARRNLAMAATLCLATGNAMVGVSLVPAAAQTCHARGEGDRWLATLLAWPELQASVRQEALALQQGRPGVTAPADDWRHLLGRMVTTLSLDVDRNANETPR